MKTFKQLFAEGAKSDTKNDGAEYKAFFAAALKKFGVSSPGELKGEDEKKFYDYIDANWNSDDEAGKDGKKDKPKTDTDEGLNASYGKDKKDLKASACKSEEHEDDEDEDEDEDEVKEDAVDRAKDVEALKKKHADEKKRETDEIERTKDKKESVELDANLLERVLNELG